ncbi:hypothetical protein PG989_014217 [Apiospora arundinis]
MEADRGRSGEEPAVPPPTKSFIPSYKWPGYHPYETVQSEPLSEHPPIQPFETKGAEQTFTNTPLPWRPGYLQRLVIAGFVGTFVLIIAAIEALLAVSNKTDGIATSHPNQHYLWTYGPIAFLTLVAAVWARAEYQSKLVAPWRRLMQDPVVDTKRTLLLDYISDFQLFAVFRALRNKDWTVSITCAVSVLMKILIVISTGLITLSWTGVHLDDHPMVVQDTFSDNNARLSKTGTMSYYVMKGLIGRNLTYPNGMSKDYAYQSVLTNLPDSAETRVTVDGFTNGLDCVPANVIMTGSRPPDPRLSDATLNLTLTSPGCDMKALRLTSPAWMSDYMGSKQNSSSVPFARFAKTQCDGTKDETGSRILVMYGNLTYTVNYKKNATDYTGHTTHALDATLNQSTQMLCTPTYTISRVEVVRNGTQTQSVELAPGGTNRTLNNIHPWAIVEAQYSAFLNAFETGSNWGRATNISTTRVDTDLYFALAIDSQLGPDTTAQPSDLLDAGFLKKVAEDYYRQFSAIVAKQSLMEPASIDITGTAVFLANRLVVRAWAAQWMAGLVIACLVLSTILLFTVPKQGFLPRNPSNIPDMASLLLHSHALQARIRDLGAVDEKSLAQGLDRHKYQAGVVQNPMTDQTEFTIVDQQQYADDAPPSGPMIVRAKRNLHPGILHPASRSALCLILIGLIIALELMLQKSNREQGLGDVGNDTYIHYTWTTLPALTFGLVAMAFSSMDFQIRSLAPYTMLKRTVNTNTFMQLDHLDMSIPRTMYKEVQSSNVGAFATTTMLLVASLFTIFSGSLFQALAVPSTGSIMLRANQSFDTTPFGGQTNAGSFSSLILESNLSYPAFTYQDLAFPQLLPDVPLESNGTYNFSTVAIDTVVPAVRSKLECRLYPMAKHRYNLTLDYKILSSTNNPLGVWIEGEECKMKPEHEWLKYNQLFSTFPNATYLGTGDPAETATQTAGCSNMLYTWGKIDYNAKPIVQHLASLGCNVTFERVDVETRFVGSDLQIDTSPGKAPKPREDTARPSAMQVRANDTGALSSIYYALANIQTDPQLLSPFFGMLVSSRFAIPMSDLGDEAANQKVADAIRLQHGIIQAQNLAQQRIPAQWSNVTLSPPFASKNDSDALARYEAVVTDTSARRRVVQDAASTRALEALLGAALILLVIGWIFMHQTDVLPRTPTSIASVAALVAGGNVLDKLPPDAEWRSRAELAAALRASSSNIDPGGEPKFWIGWGLVPDLEGRAAGSENENGFRRFGIFAVGEEETIPKDDGGKGGKMDQERRMREQVTVYDGAAGGGGQYAPVGQGGVAYNTY